MSNLAAKSALMTGLRWGFVASLAAAPMASAQDAVSTRSPESNATGAAVGASCAVLDGDYDLVGDGDWGTGKGSRTLLQMLRRPTQVGATWFRVRWSGPDAKLDISFYNAENAQVHVTLRQSGACDAGVWKSTYHGAGSGDGTSSVEDREETFSKTVGGLTVRVHAAGKVHPFPLPPRAFDIQSMATFRPLAR